MPIRPLRPSAFLCLVFFVSFLGLTLLYAGSGPSIAPGGKYAPDRILVKFRPGIGNSARAAAHVALELVSLPPSLLVYDALRLYRQRPEVLYAEPDYVVHATTTPNDPLFAQMWNLNNTGQNGGTAGADVGAVAAWNLSTGSRNVFVATIDSGIDYKHPDLGASVWTAAQSFTVTTGGGTVTCAAGSRGFNAVAGSCDPLDDNGHGTHVGGTIGALGNNTLGVVESLSCGFDSTTVWVVGELHKDIRRAQRQVNDL